MPSTNNLSCSSVHIVSQNANGLNNGIKRCEIITHLNLSSPDIICLQDVRLDDSGIQCFSNEINEFLFFANSTSSQSRGVLTLIRKSSPIKVISSWSDNDNNTLILLLNFNEKDFIVCNLYGPNPDSPAHFQNLWNEIENFNCNLGILIGDWNISLNHNLDTANYAGIRNPQSRNTVNTYIKDNCMLDAFRYFHGNVSAYTWQRPGGTQCARLDYALTTHNFAPYLTSCNIGSKFRSDHSYIELSFDFSKVQFGKGIWRFDNKLLNDPIYIHQVKKEICFSCLKYMTHPVYNDFLTEAPQDEIDLLLNAPPSDLENLEFSDYDSLLIQIFNDVKNFTISYKSSKGKSLNERAKLIRQEIENGNNDKKTEYENLINRIAEENIAMRIRNNKLEGERPSSYYLTLEKIVNSQRFMSNIKTENGHNLNNQKDIEAEIMSFYKNLYSERFLNSPFPTIRDFLPTFCPSPKLSPGDSLSMEGPITKNELWEILKKGKNGSSPGFTGITFPFLKKFWSPLGHFIEKAAADIFDKGIFPLNLRIGLISLIPKDEKDKSFLKNWRPLCVLDVCYKLISGVITSRINSHLPKLISSEQKGYVSSRYIGENIRLLHDVLEWANKKKTCGILLNIDFLKAFDSLAHKFIFDALSFFGFGQNLIGWVRIFLNDFKACTQHAGNISPPFPLQRGCKQGAPESSTLFILCLEILSLKIRFDTKIKGFKLGRFECRLSIYADDAQIFLERDPTSVRRVIEILDEFHLLSGLSTQLEKSTLTEFGHFAPAPFCNEINFKRSNSIESLGIKLTTKLNKLHENIDIKIEEIESAAGSWKHRFSTVYGRALIAKTLFFSKINHIITAIPNITKKVITDLEKLVYRFIWKDNKGSDMVARADAKISEIHGGMSFPDIFTSIQSFKLSWFRRLFRCDSNWRRILDEHLFLVSPSLNTDSLIFLGDLGWEKIATKIKSSFWKNCLKSAISPGRALVKKRPELMPFLSIWECSFITVLGQPISPTTHPSLAHKVFFAHDFMSLDGLPRMLELFEFIEIHNFIPETAEFNSITRAISDSLTHFQFFHSYATAMRPFRPFWLTFFNLTDKGCSCWNNLMKPDFTDNIRHRESTWELKLMQPFGRQFWKNLYRYNKNIIFNNKLKYLNYQIIRGTLKTNNIVNKWKNHVLPSCTFCQAEIEDIPHLFYNCPIVQNFLATLTPLMNNLGINWPPRTMTEFIFGNGNISPLCCQEYTYLYIKHFIWVSRCLGNNPELAAFRNKLYSAINIDVHLHRGGEEGVVENAKFEFIGILADRIGIG